MLQIIEGTTKSFKGNGRKLGYPTANMSARTQLEDGIYFGYSDLGPYKNQPALIFIGTPITVGDKNRRIEAHILDIPNIDYYHSKMKLEIVYFHRPNKKFPNIEELKRAMRADEAAARAWFDENNQIHKS